MSKSAEVIQLEGATLRQQLLTPIATISDYIAEISQSLRNDDMLHEDLTRISDGCKNLRGQVGDLIEGQVLLNTREAGDLSRIRHDLKNPLNSIIGYAEIILEESEGGLPENHVSLLQHVVELGGEISTTIDTAFRHAASEEGQSDEEAAIERLESTIIAGLPGSELSHGREGIRAAIADYDGLTAADLQANLITFLEQAAPVAEECGVRICLHPDDPPFSLFGLPRVVSTKADYAALFDAVPTLANGITLCAGSLGSRPDNDVINIARSFAPRIHFTHLRNVTMEPSGAFFEDDHLDGGVDMVELISILLGEEARRCEEGRADAVIPMRPDHGHLILDDIGKQTNPGYSAIGRLKGLAELRGVERAIASLASGQRGSA